MSTRFSTFAIANTYCVSHLNFSSLTEAKKDVVEFTPAGFNWKDCHLESESMLMESDVRIFWNDKQLLIAPRQSPKIPQLCKHEYLWVLWISLHLSTLLAWHNDLFKTETLMKLRVRPFIPSLQEQLPQCFPIAHEIWLNQSDYVCSLMDLPF